MRAEKHPDEQRRLAALRRYGVLDTPREAEFDHVVDVVARICGAPMAVINLIDETRQWFKAEVGLGVRELPLDDSICAHAILQPGLFLIEDTLKDDRFKDNPLCTGEPHLRFYAGALLETQDGEPLGTVCVLDHEPRTLTQDQQDFLKLMAHQVMRQLELRRAVSMLEAERKAAEEAREALEETLAEKNVLISEIDHRVKNSLQLIQTILRMQASRAPNEEHRALLDVAQARVSAVAHVHNQLHQSGDFREIDMQVFIKRLCEELQETAPKDVTLEVHAEPLKLDARRAGSVGLVINELVTNAFKYAYGNAAGGVTAVTLESAPGGQVRLVISDDGAGMSGEEEAHESPASGLGTRLVTALVSGLDGEVREMEVSQGLSMEILFPLEADQAG